MELAPQEIKKKSRGIFLFMKASVSSQIASWVDICLSYILFTWVEITFYDGFFAKAIGATSGGIINCCINYKWTFRPDDCRKRNVAVKYAMVWTGSLLLNSFGTSLMTGILSEWELFEAYGVSKDTCFMLAQLAVSLAVSICWNFMLQRYFVFRNVEVKGKVKKVIKKIRHHNGK